MLAHQRSLDLSDRDSVNTIGVLDKQTPHVVNAAKVVQSKSSTLRIAEPPLDKSRAALVVAAYFVSL